MTEPATSLKSSLQQDLTTAIRSRDELVAATVRMLLTALKSEEVSGSSARTLTDQECVSVLSREAKKRREAAAAFGEAGRAERADRELAELAVIERYLPAQLEQEELSRLVAQAIEQTGAGSPREMGAVMKVVQPQVAGRADGKAVAAEVRRQLAG